MTDTMTTEAGAARLANRIRAYWAELGYEPNTRITRQTTRVDPETKMVYFTEDDNMGVWVVRSDMVNGMPQGPKRKAEKAAA